MDPRRTRLRSALVLVAGVVAGFSFASTASAATCALSAPSYGNVGSELGVAGSGFPASAGVDVDIELDDAAYDSFSVQSDSAGNFELELTPEPADIGTWTILATSAGDCSAQSVIEVLGADQTPPSQPTAAPDGAAAGAGGEAPPRTDRALSSTSSDERGVPAMLWALGALIFLAGLGGTFVTRPDRNS